MSRFKKGQNMKSAEEIKDRLNYLEDSLTSYLDKLGESCDIEESMELENDVEIIESRISLLKWILGEPHNEDIP